MNLVIIDFDALKLEDYIDPYEVPGAMEAILAASIFPDEQKKDIVAYRKDGTAVWDDAKNWR